MRSLWKASLLLALAATAEAQYPRSGSRTSVVGTLFPDSAATTLKTGAARQLVCRGATSLQVTAQQDPSPRHPGKVAVALSYRPNPGAAGTAYEQIEPGACSWNPLGDAGVPAEPGIVYFDLDREGATNIPDPARLKIWLSDPRHYWVFYVDDLTNLSLSHGAYGGSFHVPDGLRTKPPKAQSTAFRRERLRCRGGSGLAFARRGRQGDNLVGVRLTYPVASRAAGPVGGGLEPGTCAWADRTDARQEPGRIMFTTPATPSSSRARTGARWTARRRRPSGGRICTPSPAT
jgi:hypothetical protein